MRAVSCRPLTDERLLDFLRLEEDRVPRTIAEEIVSRGDRLRAPLAALCRDDLAWRHDGPAFWLPVHAAYLLGAVGGPAALPGLLDALRHSARYDVDWVWELIPSLIGPVGRPALPPLRTLAFDPRGAERERVVAVHALAAVAARHPVEQGEVLDLLRAAVEDPREERGIRGAAGLALLAFARPGDRPVLLARPLAPYFEEKDVEAAYARGGPDLRDYTLDPLAFYDPERIEERRRRWRDQEEDDRWARGAAARGAWVEREGARLLRLYEAALVDLDDETRGDALWVADSMAEYLVWHEGRAPWRWNGATAFAYLMDAFARRVAFDLPGRIARVPDAMALFIRFCRAEGKLAEKDAAEALARIAAERAALVGATADPERRREAREQLGRLVSEGVDPSRLARVGSRVRRSSPPSPGRRSRPAVA
ncbi:MAG TPA: hypothetical protein VF950_30045 [Planctomycetota bacterium]